MTRVLHIRCGSDIREAIAGLGGDFLEFSDPICQGPVPGGVDFDAYLESRVAYLADTVGAGERDALRARLRAEYEGLGRAGEYDAAILWFEHDLYDQALLIRALSWMQEKAAMPGDLRMVRPDAFLEREGFRGLGQLTLQELAGLEKTAAPVTPQQLECAVRAWRIYSGDDPQAVLELSRDENLPLPYLALALRRHLEELPWTGSGLSLTERLILQSLQDGAGTPVEAFRRILYGADWQPFWGDALFWSVVRRLAEASEPAFAGYAGEREPVSLTEYGRALLEERADWLQNNSPNRWWGGVNLDARPVRWNPCTQSVEE